MKKAKKSLLYAALAAFVSLICIFFTACGSNAVINYTLYFRVDGDVYATVSTTGNEIIQIPEDPEKEGYTFDGWYWDNDTWSKPFTANSLLDAPISSNMSVFAKFITEHEHVFSADWSYDAEYHWYDCSCGEKGSYAAHTWSEWTVVTPATETNNGLEERFCAICGQKVQREINKPVTGEKQNYDMSKVVFANVSVTYNGDAHYVYATNLPAGVTVSYENNGQTNAGTYTITAKFSGDTEHYNEIPDMTAQLIIKKATYDMSSVEFKDYTIGYDGEIHNILISELPVGVTVGYYVNGKVFAGATEVGEYEISARFSGDYDNYDPIDEKTAILTISMKVLDTPVITKIEYDTVYWGAVDNADCYVVRVNDNYECTLRGTSCDLADVRWGERAISDYGIVSVKVLAKGGSNYSKSNWSEIDNSYYYVPETINKDGTNTTELMNYSIGFGYNLIEDEYLKISKCSTKSIFNIGKLLTIANYSEKRINNGINRAYNYKNIDEFVSNNKASFEYNSKTGCVLLGSVKMQIDANISFNYRSYSYNHTFIYEYDVVCKNRYLTNFSNENLLAYCLSDNFLKDIRKESVSTSNMTDNQLVEYLYDTYGTHAILGVVTGGTIYAAYTTATNDKENALSIGGKIGVSTEGDAIDQIIQKDMSVALELENTTEWKNSETKSTFEMTYRGGESSVQFEGIGKSDVSFALSNWGVKDGNDVAIRFTDNGAISIVSLLSYIDYTLATKLDNYINERADALYKELFDKFSTSTTLPLEMQTADGINTLVVDLSNFQEVGNLNNATYPSFSDNVLTVYPTMFAKEVDVIKVIGAYNTYKTPIESFSIKLSEEWSKDVRIVLENVGVCAANENGFIDSSSIINQQVKFTVDYIGENAIVAHDGTGFSAAQSALVLEDLKITSSDPDASLTVRGGNGLDGTTAGSNGQDGACAIIVDRLTIDAKGTIYVYGGNGGNGAVGANGSPGGNGGHGGSGLVVANLRVLSTGVCNVFAGVGGNGGAGGKQTSIPSKRPDGNGNARPSKGDTGYDGGNGGKGGNSGRCVITSTMEVDKNSKIYLNESNSGVGGAGGAGGTGGEGGDSTWWLGNVQGGDGGTGGTGGKGGDAGTILNALLISETVVTVSDTNIIINICNPQGGAGAGGAGGAGGTGGKNTNYDWYGKTGASGEPGEPGLERTHE